MSTREFEFREGSSDKFWKITDAAITAVVNYEGTVSYGYILPSEDLTVAGCCFVKGLRAPSGFGEGLDKKIKLDDVDPLVISETLHELTMLAEKGKS